MKLKHLLAVLVAFNLGADAAMAEQPSASKTSSIKPKTETAIFAGGCFWCMQPAFDQAPGVLSTTVGYTGGAKANPTYEEVCTGSTGHAEAIQVIFDPKKVSYEQLLEVFWHNINPTTPNQQFADRGTQYRSAIFYLSPQQQQLAEASKEKLAHSGKFDKPIATEITQASAFYPAEEYHQKYYQKNAIGYNLYKVGSGRADYIKKTWGGH